MPSTASTDLETLSDRAAALIQSCGGDPVAAVRALLDHLSTDLDRTLAAVSEGFVRGRPKRSLAEKDGQ